MRIAIAGGTGTLGSRVAGQLREHGHDIRVLSRNAPEYRVDLTTGEGLRGGALTAERLDVRGTTRFAAWLAAAQA
jgi:uncharacterized protein YbjT (DUF2867 family)